MRPPADVLAIGSLKARLPSSLVARHDTACRADGIDQNVTRRPNWICRAGAAELITPNVDDPKTVPGFPKFVWLMTLKTSARNSAWTFWVTVKLRISDMSTWITPGPRTIPTPAFPNA